MIRRALRDNNEAVAAVSIAAISTLVAAAVNSMRLMSLEAKIMALSLAWCGLHLLQRVLVGKRRHSRHWLVQYGAMVAYYLPTPLALYVARAVNSSSQSAPDLALYAVLLLVSTVFLSSFGVTNMTAYSLRDAPRDRWRFFLWLWAAYITCIEWENLNVVVAAAACSLILVVLPTEYFRYCETKAFADYMKQESKSSSSPFFDDSDANSSLQLDCCRYPIGNQKDGQWISIKDAKLYMQNANLGTCLCYSLSRLLARRYYRLHCAEEGNNMVRRFALADLGTDHYRRAFDIVEVQLALLHNYFFTATLLYKFDFPLPAPGPVKESDSDKFVRWFIVLVLFLSLGIPYLSFPEGRSNTVQQDSNQTTTILVILLLVVVSSLSMFSLVRMEIVRLTKRFPGHMCFANEHCIHPSNTKTRAYWSNKIDQYSILHDYNRRRPLRKAFVAWLQEIMLSQPLYRCFTMHLPVVEQDIKVPDSVRKLIADTLYAINCPPTNGTRSLQINRKRTGYDWSWTCREETHTDTILIWHIATCYCGMTPPYSYRPDGFPRLVEIDTLYEVATTLSRYCAYLVAFLPEFLPEHHLTTKETFQRVVQEAQGALGTTPMEEKEKLTKIQGLQLPPQREQQTTVHKGIMLGRQLEKLDTRLRWKVMAEFWAETILYIAPSDNAEAHIEHLAKGGEFITHLWAMLSNAGILKRATGEWHPPPAPTTKRGLPKKIETTKATRTQECPF